MQERVRQHREKRKRSYVFSSRILYCSSPWPPSTSWSSFVISSFSNCKARTDYIKLWPTFIWQTKWQTYSQRICLHVTPSNTELFTQTDTRLSDRTDLYLSFLHLYKRAGCKCSAFFQIYQEYAFEEMGDLLFCDFIWPVQNLNFLYDLGHFKRMGFKIFM